MLIVLVVGVTLVAAVAAVAWDIATTSSDPKSDEMNRGIEAWRAVRRSMRR